MSRLSREAFLKKVIVASLGTFIFPKLLFGSSKYRNSIQLFDGGNDVKSKTPINDFGIVDLHCHPSLKMYLWNKRIWRRYHPKAGTNPFPLQDTVNELSSGYVKGLLVAHYLVEGLLVSEAATLKKLFPWIKRFFPRLSDKVEHEDYSNFTQINMMIDTMESQIHLANQKQKKIHFVIARDYPEFEQAIKDGNLPIAHAIEGAHALGRNFPLTEEKNKKLSIEKNQMGSGADAHWYLRNLEALKKRGVCLMTIAHIFQNDIAFPTEGISADEKKKIRMDRKYDPEKDDLHLSDIGKQVVAKMLDIGMIVDLTHSTPAARQDVFKINRERAVPRPLTFTHVGSQEVFEKYDKEFNKDAYDTFKYYNINKEEVDQISECDGVIGIIPENFWLVACDTHLNKKYAKKFRDGINYIVETILYINSKTRTKDFDNISIGTDFDGFADAPHDLYKPSQLGKLIEAMRDAKISDNQIKKITSLNSLRLLRKGWV